MTDYTELKRLAQAALPRDDSPHLPCTVAFDRAASPAVVLSLIAENEALRQFILGLAEYDTEIAFAYAAMGKAAPDRPLPAGCWEWVVPKGTEAPCRACSGFGTIETGIDEAPSTICNACNGTGKEP